MLLARRVREHHWAIFPHWEKGKAVCACSCATTAAFSGITASWLRSREQAVAVERMTGREGAGTRYQAEGHRHPTLEVRLTPEHLAVELIVAPSAWWDQRNIIGKLSIARHQQALIDVIRRLPDDLRVGFWEGVHLSDTQATLRQLLRGGRLLDWLGTFGDGQDWLRVGAWYPFEAYAPDVLGEQGNPLMSEHIVGELFARMSALYSLYTFMVWTSNNNFHSFYTGRTLSPGSTGRDRLN
jgi:hypothetical protein